MATGLVLSAIALAVLTFVASAENEHSRSLDVRDYSTWLRRPPTTNVQCPVKRCRGSPPKHSRDHDVFLDTGSRLVSDLPSYPLPIHVAAETGGSYEVDEKTGMNIYNVDFKPGHFTCLSCDVGTCEGCDIMCDLSQCIGEFYVQECWCQRDQDVRLGKPLWEFREYDANFIKNDGLMPFFCDAKCGGGICDTAGLQCKRREDACKPWWWCNLSPPKEDTLQPKDNWSDGHSYTTQMTLTQIRELNAHHSGAQAVGSNSHKAGRNLAALRQGRYWKLLSSRRNRQLAANQQLRDARRAARVEKARLRAKTRATLGTVSGEIGANDFGRLSFRPGRFVCEAAALPPKVQDPKTMLWNDRGYLVLDRASCKVTLFDSKCFCWDQVLHLKGKDPLTSEFTCDGSCQWGACEGRTCASSPPQPLTASTPAPALDPIAVEQLHAGELHDGSTRMDPALLQTRKK